MVARVACEAAAWPSSRKARGTVPSAEPKSSISSFAPSGPGWRAKLASNLNAGGRRGRLGRCLPGVPTRKRRPKGEDLDGFSLQDRSILLSAWTTGVNEHVVRKRGSFPTSYLAGFQLRHAPGAVSHE